MNSLHYEDNENPDVEQEEEDDFEMEEEDDDEDGVAVPGQGGLTVQDLLNYLGNILFFLKGLGWGCSGDRERERESE